MEPSVPIERFAGVIPAGARAALPAGELRATVLPGGRAVNLSLRIDCGELSRVLRVRRPRAPAPGAHPAREIDCQRRAAAAGLAPAVLAADANQGWVLMEHVPGAPWTVHELRHEASLARLCAKLRALHAVEPPAAPREGPLAFLRASCALLAAAGQRDPALLGRGEAAAAAIDALRAGEGGRPPVICHGDPDAGNFVGEAPMLVDFEYAQVADPTWDLALLLDYYPWLETRLPRLLELLGLDDPVTRRVLPLQRELCAAVNRAWAASQALPPALA